MLVGAKSATLTDQIEGFPTVGILGLGDAKGQGTFLPYLIGRRVLTLIPIMALLPGSTMAEPIR